MKEIFLQLKETYIGDSLQLVFVPWEDTDIEQAKEFKINQVVRGKVEGVEKPRVLEQLGLWWSFCEFTRLYMGIEYLNTREKMSDYVKIKINFVDYNMNYNGVSIVKPSSLSYDKLGHKKACLVVTEGIEFMADMCGTTVEKIKEALEAEGKLKRVPGDDGKKKGVDMQKVIERIKNGL